MKNRNIEHRISNTEGFTLIETLVAVTVLVVSLAGPLFLADRSFVSATIARDKTTASYLAQEGMEFARKVRDTNFLAGASWLTSLSSCVANSCTVDVKNNSLSVCSGTCPALNYDSTTRLYNHSITSGTNKVTRFTRGIRLTQISSTEYLVTVTVTWTDRGVTRSVVSKENIHDWQ
jgi:prepilin-type N-terminal cleavage/methylation domain-containing protein